MIYVYELITINKNCYWKHSLYPDGTLFSEYIKSNLTRGNLSTEVLKEKTKVLNNNEVEKFKSKNKDFLSFTIE